MPNKPPKPPWMVPIVCKREKCSRTFLRTRPTKLYCSTGCKVMDWEHRNGKVYGYVRRDPATGKRILTLMLD